MSDFVKWLADYCARSLELAGVGLIVLLAAYALVWAILQLLRRVRGKEVWRESRHRLVRGVLLGLEFLVAADIIHTVAVSLTWTSVGVLAVVVLIRTFLSFTLEVEITGRWPWQKQEQETG